MRPLRFHDLRASDARRVQFRARRVRELAPGAARLSQELRRPPATARSRLSDREWDIMLDSTARYVDSITDEERADPGPERSASLARRIGDYLRRRSSCVPLLSREHTLPRPGTLRRDRPARGPRGHRAEPPRVIVTFDERDPMMRAFPELRRLRDERYVHTKLFRYMRVFELKSSRAPFIASR